jgi:hypothetical protein
MKRPLADKRPIIQFADLFDFSSSNSSTNQCRVCFDGYTKIQVFKSIRDSFLKHKQELHDDLSEAGLDIVEIAVAGSVATYEFGCSDVEVAKGMLDVFIREIWPANNMSPEAINDSKIVKQQSSISEMWRVANESSDIGEGMLFDIRTIICSDIDIVVVESGKQTVNLQENTEVRNIKASYTDKMDEEILGLMAPEIDFTNENLGISGPSLSQPEEFNRIIEAET